MARDQQRHTRRSYNATPEDQREPLAPGLPTPPPHRRPPNQSGGDGASGSGTGGETPPELSLLPAVAAPSPSDIVAVSKRARTNSPPLSSSSSPHSGDDGSGGGGSNSKLRRLRKQLKKLERERQTLLVRLSAAQREMRAIDSERQDTLRAADTLEAVLQLQHGALVRERDERMRQEERVNELRADVAQREQAIAQLNVRLAEVQARLEAVQARLDELQAQEQAPPPPPATTEFVRGERLPVVPEVAERLLRYIAAHGTCQGAVDDLIAVYAAMRL